MKREIVDSELEIDNKKAQVLSKGEFYFRKQYVNLSTVNAR
jgi:hypothetical protein